MKASETSVVVKSVSAAHSYAHILLSPRITEKATDLARKGSYVFNVDPRANRKEIAMAVTDVYGVKPLRVSTICIAPRKTFVRGRKGQTAGGKKAVVYLRPGEKIEFV